MDFDGFQKLTLLDFPGKVACTLFTGGCNFRCPFCHNASLVLQPESIFTEETILQTLRKRQGILDGVCITGGEPLMQKQLPDFLRKVRDLGLTIKLDTNGAFPQQLRQLVADGLVDYVAMDIKNAPNQYAKTVGLDTFDISPIMESVSFLLANGIEYEFRTTVVSELHNDESFHEIGAWIATAKRYFLQAFSDSGNLLSSNVSGCNPDEMERFRQICAEYIPNTTLRGM